MAKVTGPLGPRRGIGDALKKLREDQGKSLNDVAGDLMMSTSKLSRLENAQGTPLPRDIRDLIAYYQIQGTPLAASLERWAREAGRRGWWTDFDDEVTEGLDAHLAYEVDAAVERVYTLPFLPALLQTRDYARAVFRDMEGRSPEQIRQLLEVRERRQEALGRREDPGQFRLIAVTYESTLHQQVGSAGIMREQLEQTRGARGRPQREPARAAVHGPAGVLDDLHVRAFRVPGGGRVRHRERGDPRRVLQRGGADARRKVPVGPRRPGARLAFRGGLA